MTRPYNRDQCLTQLTITLKAYIRAIAVEAEITHDAAREVAEHCARHIIYALEMDEDTDQ